MARLGERESARDVQEAVAKPPWLGLGELPVERQRLGPDDQIVGEHDDLKPDFVQGELFEREL